MKKNSVFSQLALMLNSGLPLLKSLGVLAERLPPKTAQLCLGIERDLKMGTSFAGCIKQAGVMGRTACSGGRSR